MSQDDITVVVPTLNEEHAIGVVIDELRQAGYRNILVVDGYSTDGTFQIAQEKGVAAFRQEGIGKAGAIRTGIKHAETPYIVFIDADYTYDPRDIERLHHQAGRYDQIIGTRVDRQNIPKLHRVGNKIINLAFNLVMGTRVTDICSGMYLVRKGSARKLNLSTKGFDVEVEIVAQILAVGGKIIEVPIHYRKRIGAKKLQTWKAGLRILITTLSLFRYRKSRV